MVGITLLLLGAEFTPAPPRWDYPISFIMALLAYATASWSLRVLMLRQWCSWVSIIDIFGIAPVWIGNYLHKGGYGRSTLPVIAATADMWRYGQKLRRSTMNAVQTVGRAKATGLHRKEWAMVLVALGMVMLALLAPHVGDSPHQHHFADQRTLWGVPCALDVLSNLPFAFAGLWGLVRLRASRFAGQPPAWRATMALFFVGLVCTSVGSSVYHWQPDNAGLLWDRLGMAVAFAGMLGLAVTQRISERAGLLTAALTLLAGPAAVVWWSYTGNVMPWAVVQLGGMLVVLGLAFVRAVPGMPAVSLGAVIAWYGVAKLAEAGDHAVFAATGQWVSGHTLKHLFAAGAAWPVLAALGAGRVNAPVQQPAKARRSSLPECLVTRP